MMSDPTPARILLVDDDVELAGMLRDYLVRDGFEVLAVPDGESGVAEALSGRFALVVLDVMMPGIGGIEALRRIRAASTVPVLMLTARGDDLDRIVGLELGADDYVPKPCLPRELAARLRAILRRTLVRSAAPGSLSVGDLALYPAQRRITWHDQELPLTNAEFNLLELLIQNAGQVVSKSLLSEQGLGRPFQRYDRSIDVHLSSIRHKLPRLPDGRPRIQAVLRKGYQLLTG